MGLAWNGLRGKGAPGGATVRRRRSGAMEARMRQTWRWFGPKGLVPITDVPGGLTGRKGLAELRGS